MNIDNLITFVLLFQVDDTHLLRSDMNYIWEKYQSMIGLEPKVGENEIEDVWQSIHLNNLDALAVKARWVSKWGTKKLDKNKERVLNYLCVMETLDKSPKNIFDTFDKYIGNASGIKVETYNHIHPIFRKFVDEYKVRFRRELNLEILV